MLRGLIEGFYGRPWTWDERLELCRWCADRGMDTYVYAPKDDPLHREQWRDTYPAGELDGFRRLVDGGGLTVAYALSPGLSIDYGSAADREVLWAKVASVLDAGVALVVLALDDIPNRPGLGEDHAELTTWLHGRLEGVPLALVPTEYVGSRPTPYLTALATGVPDDVLIGWTGDAVVLDELTVASAEARAAALGGRPPLLWDNWPVNDAVMDDRLFLGPLRGRDPGLLDACSGYLANPMVQPLANKLPLASTCAWLRGDDPEAAWAATADELGWRVFAEACDGVLPNRLVAAGDAAPLREWLAAAAAVEAPGIDAEVEPWLEQCRTEAKVGLDALRLLETDDDAAVLLGVMKLMRRWPRVRRSAVSVLGPRCSFRPVLGQRDDGQWVYRREALEEDGNALDALVRKALERAAR